MKLTLDLPERDFSGHPGYEHDGSLAYSGDCGHCDTELGDTNVKLAPFGWIHASCLPDAVAKLTADPEQAWQVVARHVARHPSKHSASTVRAVITQLLK